MTGGISQSVSGYNCWSVGISVGQSVNLCDEHQLYGIVLVNIISYYKLDNTYRQPHIQFL